MGSIRIENPINLYLVGKLVQLLVNKSPRLKSVRETEVDCPNWIQSVSSTTVVNFKVEPYYFGESVRNENLSKRASFNIRLLL